jgi:hypothetical protein
MKPSKFAATALLVLAVGAVHAQSVNAPFTVTVNFTPKCTTTNASAPVIAFGTYNAFDAAKTDVPLSAPYAVKCSRGLNPTATFDNLNALNGLFDTGNLRYELTAPTKSAIQAGDAATASDAGSPDTYEFTFKGTLPQQAGSSVGGALSAARNLVISF